MVRELAGTRAAISPPTMNHTHSPFETLSLSPPRTTSTRSTRYSTAITGDELATVTGGGIGAQIGAMFGDKGAQWGGIADGILGMFGGAFPGLGMLTGGLGAMTGGSPTSGAPTSGAPTSGAPTSGAPTSGSPAGGFNMSGITGMFGNFMNMAKMFGGMGK
jgi:hypothetical protein